jgi:hypothetical protein
MTDPVAEGMPYKIALILDGKVEQVYYCSQEDAAKLLSGPTFYEIPEGTEVENGFSFDGTNFSA